MCAKMAAHGRPPLGRLFEPFFTTKPVGQGSGLGLATIYGVVHHDVGQVMVTSATGQGTPVSVWWPGHPQTSAAQVADARGEAVLIVDDDDWVRTLTGRLLRRAGYGVMEAPQTSDALAILSGVAGACIKVVIADGALAGSPGVSLKRDWPANDPSCASSSPPASGWGGPWRLSTEAVLQ